MAFDRWPDKDPDAIKDYAVDWSSRLQDGEAITASTWTPNDPALVVESAGLRAPTVAGGVCTCWLSGGVDGIAYQVVNHIETSRGMVDDKTMQLRIRAQ